MSREHSGLAGLSLAPWEEPCTEDADTAADERAALAGVEDAGAEVYSLDGEWRVRRGDVLLGGGGERRLAVRAAVRVLDVLDGLRGAA